MPQDFVRTHSPARTRRVSGHTYQRDFGAIPGDAGVRFRVFAPDDRDLRLHLLTGRAVGMHHPAAHAQGVFDFFVHDAGPGDRYAFTLDGSRQLPDPASRFQPEGVHGPSEIVDASRYTWQHTGWRGRDLRELVVYELHVGTFTNAGTFAGLVDRLAALGDLGVTAIELMPVAEFAGTRNWGYDGACLFAPSRNYGRPDDLRALVDAAHGFGLAVLLDVVYNHLGPEGAYLTQFHPQYMTARHTTPWGDAVNLDSPGSDLVRAFIIDNAVHWIREYHLDGLRLDATHALIDTSATHVVAELVDAVRTETDHPVIVHAEDYRNLAMLVEPRDAGGWGLDGVWADDFHHIIRRQIAADSHGYFADFSGSPEELAKTIKQGWLFTGQHSEYMNVTRGTDVSHIPMHKFVVCLQNHDQIGNRANGDRLHHTIDLPAWRAASTLLLTVPMTPLLFMGQEWASSSPFLYFTDLEPELGRLVTQGRRHEFRHFPGFTDPAARERIPDPQAPDTFEASRLDWSERGHAIHKTTLALYHELLRLRRTHRALAASDRVEGEAIALNNGLLFVRRQNDEEIFWILAHLGDGSAHAEVQTDPNRGRPRVIFSTEDERFALDPQPPEVREYDDRVVVRFERPGAVIVNAA